MKYPPTENGALEMHEEKPQGWFFPTALIDLYEARKINAEELTLLGKLAALQDIEKGGCWASNVYLAKWWGKSSNWVSISISRFQKLGLIECKFHHFRRKTRRVIRITWFGNTIRKVTRYKKSHTGGIRKVNASNDTSYHTSMSNGADAPLDGFGLLNTQDNQPGAKLARRYLRFLIRNNLHLSRSDLPDGDSPQSQRRRKSTMQKWMDAFASLLKRAEREQIVKVLDWYFENYRGPYVPTCKAATTFCEAFEKVEKAMKRDTNGSDGQPETDGSSIKNERSWIGKDGARYEEFTVSIGR